MMIKVPCFLCKDFRSHQSRSRPVLRGGVVSLSVFFFFFFQAEDGIRDDLVTGVQTCALPISMAFCGSAPWEGLTASIGAMGRTRCQPDPEVATRYFPFSKTAREFFSRVLFIDRKSVV